MPVERPPVKNPAAIAVDGCTTKAPCGGQTAGPSPVDRRKQGLRRSVAVGADGMPLAAVPAPANHRDDGLLAATLDAIAAVGPLPAQPVVHLDAGYDPTHAWGNQYGKLRWCTERRRLVVEFWLALVNAAIVCGRRSAAPGSPTAGRAAHDDGHSADWRRL